MIIIEMFPILLDPVIPWIMRFEILGIRDQFLPFLFLRVRHVGGSWDVPLFTR